MKTIADFLDKLKEREIIIDLENGKLKIKAPKGTVSHELLDELSSLKTDIVDYLSTIPKRNFIEPVSTQELYPASHAQIRLWTLSQLPEASVAYQIISAHVIEGPLNVDIFRKSFEVLIQRHEILRTIFIHETDGLKQKILPGETQTFDLNFHDIQGNEDWFSTVQNFCQEAYKAPFNLDEGPLLRSDLFQLDHEKYAFLFNLHHIISDGWSAEIFVSELTHIYDVLLRGEASELAPLEIQHKDFAVWQKGYLNGGKSYEDKKYWKNRFTDLPPVLKLPELLPRPKNKGFQGRRKSFFFNKNLVTDLKILAEEGTCSLYVVVVSILNVLFYKYTGQTDIIVGTTTTGRTNQQLANQIGFYVNTLPLRTTFDKNDSFLDLLQNTSSTILELFDHESYPFDKLIDDLEIAHTASRAPLFDILIEMHNFQDGVNTHKDNYQLSNDVQISTLSIDPNTSIFDINLEFKEVGDALALDIEYNVEVLLDIQIEYIVKHFEKLALQICENPNSPVSHFEVILDEEKSLLDQFNLTNRDDIFNTTALSKFISSTAAYPDKIAISDSEQEITFNGINAFSSQLSRAMSAHEVQRQDVVVVLMDRSCHFLSAILAIWKCGAIYLPLDPLLSEDRISYIIKDSRAKALITTKKYIKESLIVQWQSETLSTIICLDSKDIYSEREPLNESMKSELWEFIGKESTDEITGGGWIDSYTGNPISRLEMDEYRDNVCMKLSPYLKQNSHVLEIGSASGITMFAIAPKVASYTGVDLSSAIIERNEERIKDENHENITQLKLYAHEIDQLQASTYDIIIINSVIQNFNGYNYLRDVISKGLLLLKPKGVFFFGDIMDASQKDALINSLEEFKKNNRGNDFKTKIDWTDEFFVNREFFDNFFFESDGIASVKHSEKIHTIPNELTRFRFDTIVNVDKNATHNIDLGFKKRYQLDLRSIHAQSPANVFIKTLLDDVAYIIYTSGSTGKPKGAVVEHLGMFNHIQAKISDLNIDSTTILAQNASQSFDISVWQFITTLCAGGKTKVIGKDITSNPREFTNYLKTEHITIVELVPSYLSVLLDTWEEDGIPQFPNLQFLVVTGEAIKSSLVKRWYNCFPSIQMINAYGPTEASDDITHFTIPTTVEGTVAVGQPILNTKIYVVDDQMNLCPIGVTGEVCVSGAGVGRGYLNDPEKTAQSFVANPFAKIKNSKLYKTGDLGRYMFNGILELGDRKDFQVKIRGHRIELGEIEYQLCEIDVVKDAVVIAIPNGETKELHAFVTTHKNGDATIEKLRASLSKKLPEYSIPSQISAVQLFPLTRNGKVDREALKNLTSSSSDKAIQVPKTSTEKRLLRIWTEILDIQSAGTDENFFESGGHSLKATRLVMKVNSLMNTQIALRDVFNYPTVASLSAYINQKSPESIYDIEPVEPEDNYPVTNAQQRLWVISQVDEANKAYNELSAFEWSGPLNKNAFDEALHLLIERHESLRTTFHFLDGELRQRINPVEKAQKAVEEIDITTYPDGAQKIEELVEETLHSPLDLEKGTLLKVTRIKQGKDKYVILFTSHHIVSDGWSDVVMLDDFLVFYDSQVNKKPNPLSKLEIQYKDYSVWLRQFLASGHAEEDRQFWLNTLSGELPVLALPTYKKRPLLQTNKGGSFVYTFNEEITQWLKQTSREQETTLFNVLVSALNTLFYKVTGQTDIIVGTSIANRDQEVLARQVGFYLNMIPLRNSIDPYLSFGEIIQKIKTNTVAAISHRKYPFDRIVEDINIARDPSRSPIFDVLIEHLDYSSELQSIKSTTQNAIKQVQLAPYPINQVHSKVDLNFSFYEEESLKVHVVHNTDIYSQQQIHHLLENLVVLLNEIISTPDLAIGRMSLITDRESTIFQSFNKHEVEFNYTTTFVEMFSQQVHKASGNIALVSDQECLTFQQLDEQSNKFANILLRLGLRKETLIPVLSERSSHLLIALLGILKAGGVYVPLDPESPLTRINEIINDTCCDIIVVSNQALSDFPVKDWSKELKLIVPDGILDKTHYSSSAFDSLDFEMSPSDKVDITIAPEDLAYVIYTSGSTGKPKGVMIEHRGMVNHLLVKNKDLKLDHRSVVSQNASHTFDISIWQFLSPLLAGGRVVIYPNDLLLSVGEFIDKLDEDGVTILEVVPSYLAVIYEYLISKKNDSTFSNLTYLLVTGEVVRKELISDWFGLFPDIPIVNAYGPTEASDDVTHYIFDSVPDYERIPIGKPLPHVKIDIVDNDDQLVPMGAVGEISISGIALGRGYLNNPTLTSEKFVSQSDYKGRTQRAYRTGDLGRWLDNGLIDYLGRTDTQIKIRGHRIELGEIENAIQQSGLSKQNAVLARTDNHGKKILVAYLIPKEGCSKEAVTAFIRSCLPGYMVPHFIILMPNLPLTSNGKIDRNSLPEISDNGKEDSKYIAPDHEIEKILAEIWEDLLNLQRISVNDNFFELGGDSITTIQTVNRLRQFGYALKPTAIFENQTIASLAIIISESSSSSIIAEQGKLTGEVALLPIQRYFFETFDSPSPLLSHYNQSLLLELSKNTTTELLRKAVDALFDKHDALRLIYKRRGNDWVQSYDGAESGFAVEEISEDSSKTIEEQVTEICNHYQRNLDLELGIVAKVVCIKTPVEVLNNRFFIVVHHLAIDGVSWTILLQDLEIILDSLSSENKQYLDTDTTSYRQWGSMLGRTVITPFIEKQLPYWKNVAKEYKALPVDNKVNKATHEHVDTYVLEIPENFTDALLKDVHLAYKTEVRDILVAALCLTIGRWSELDSLVIGMEDNGRQSLSPNMDVSNTVGWFTNIYPTNFDLSNNLETQDVIRSVKEQLRRVPANGIGYGMLRYMHPSEEVRNALASACWDIEFNYLGQYDTSNIQSSRFSSAKESPGNNISSKLPFTGKFIIDISVQEGKLVIAWNYSQLQYRSETIALLARDYLQSLEKITQHCASVKEPIISPSDFGLQQEISIVELDTFLESLTRKRGITPSAIDDIYELTPMQEGMLFYGLYQSTSPAYNEQLVVDLPDGINKPAFKMAWNDVIQSHTILRTGFFYEDFGTPVQCVFSKASLDINEVDLSHFSSKELDSQLESFLIQDRHKTFDFDNPPLVRLTLIKLDEARYKLLWTHHHIILDGWSIPLLMERLLNNYKACLEGEHIPTIDKVDTFKSLIEHIRSVDVEDQTNFWSKYCRGIENPTLLPFVKTPQRNTGIGAIKYSDLNFSEEITSELIELAQKHHLTVNTIIQGVWALLLTQYTGDKSVVFGATVSGRPASIAEAEDRIGLYINTIPLRSVFQPEDNLIDWLTNIQIEHSAAREFQHAGLKSIQKLTSVKGDLFDSIIVFENYPVEAIQKAFAKNPVLEIGATESHEQTNFTLTLVVHLNEKLSIKFGHYEEEIDHEQISAVKDHFTHTLAQIIRQPNQSLSKIQLVSPKEKDRLLFNFNTKNPDLLGQETIVDLFETQVRKIPNHDAVIFEGSAITFSELNQRANQLSNFILTKVNKGSLIGICLERSFDMISAVLAVLKAGCAYVPLDPDYPQARIAHILTDAQVPLIITSTTISLSHETLGQTECLTLDTSEEYLMGEIDSNPGLPIKIDDLCYVIYTSGSTGKPKGVAVEHGGLTNMIVQQIDHFKITNDSTTLQFASLNFDASCSEIFTSLIGGGVLVLPNREDLLSLESLQSIITEHKVNIATLPPSYQVLLKDNWGTLNTIISAGEPLNLDIAKNIRQSGIRLINAYGPTENTVCVSMTDCPFGEDGTVTIGQPLDNVEVYILDEYQRLLPQGIVGEMYISGRQVARGYLNQPELCAEKFIENPFFDNKTYLYKTGDLGKWNKDGNLEYCGRIDEQIKVRGYRIEPAEIINTLLEHEDVEQATVITKSDANNNVKLVGYVVNNESYDRKAMQKHLSVSLPGYMVPHFLIEIPELPLTPNGKVDKEMLPDPKWDHENEKIGPRNELEDQMVNLWKKLLGTNAIGIHDNFFELGGDSIISIQLVNSLRKMGYSLTPRDIFDHSTISRLCEVVRRNETRLIKGEQGTLTGTLELSPIQHWFFSFTGDKMSHFNQSVLLNVDRAITRAQLENAIGALVAFHDSLRLTFQQQGDIWHQSYGSANSIIEVADLSHVHQLKWQKEIADLCDINQSSLSIDEGKLIRTVLIKTPSFESENRLLIIVHHLAIDVVSWRIILEQLNDLLTSFDDEVSYQLGPKPTSYRQWVSQLKEYSATDHIMSEYKHWKQVMSKCELIPAELTQERACYRDLEGITATLSKELTSTLLKEVHQAYQTEINDLLISSLGLVLLKWLNKDHVVIGMEGHGREDTHDDLNISETVGWFSALYPVLITMPQDLSAGETIRIVKEQLRSVPNKGLGYGILRHLNTSEDVRNGLKGQWDVVFNYLGQLDNTLNNSRWFSEAPEPTGRNTALDFPVDTKLIINAQISNGHFRISWSYSTKQFSQKTIQTLVNSYIETLTNIIKHCATEQNNLLTPNDYGLSDTFTVEELDEFLKKVQ